MTPEQFCYWLQGRAELQPDNPPSVEEWTAIREHLATVFVKVTPPIGVPDTFRHWVPTAPNTGGSIPLRAECVC